MHIGRINMVLPPDVAIREVVPVHDDAHARFDAVSRQYHYRITLSKDPFSLGRSYHYTMGKELDLALLNQSARMLTEYSEFFPFCKARSDTKTKKCKLTESTWTRDGDSLVYLVTADRFLRGMVRLIVGMCLNVALGKLALDEVKKSMDLQIPMPRSWSVPAEGLYLTRIRYPFMQS
jgi:tRNA pseudouridine38-40 synthase